MTKEEVISLINDGELGKAWHALGEMTHKGKKVSAGAQPMDGDGSDGDNSGDDYPKPTGGGSGGGH